jgi:hypothetical protein
MIQDEKRHSDEKTEDPPTGVVPLDVDDLIDDARTAIHDLLLEHLNNRVRVFGEGGLDAADLSDGILIAVLKLVTPAGKYPMETGRFWQLVDRYGPHSPLPPDDEIRDRVTGEVQSLLAAAEHESFEAGFDSALALEFQRLVLMYGELPLQTVAGLLGENRMAPRVAAEILACLGEMENAATYEVRRQLLEHSLASASHVIRDGAVVALAGLRDPRSAAALERAAAQEAYPLLRTNMLTLSKQIVMLLKTDQGE